MNKKQLIAAMLTATTLTATNAEEITTTADDQTALNVTIYNNNVALIKDTRNVQLATGVNKLAFKDVSASIQSESAIVKADKVALLEQNFEYDLLSPDSLLNKYIGKTVTVATTNYATGEVKEEQATILSNNNGTMLKIGNKIRKLAGDMSVIYDDVPKNLRDKPTLIMKLDNQGAEKQQLELSYLSNQLNWQADYVANLVDDKKLNLKGWVTLTNNSGTTYKNAKLQLVAGNVNRVQPEVLGDLPVVGMAFKKEKRLGVNVQEETLFEYHLYSLGFPTTIKDKQQKQVSLLEASNVPYKKQLVVTARDSYGWYWWGDDAEYQEQKVNAQLVIDNKKVNNLGMSMPAGVVRTYLNDSKGSMQFIGEDRIKHTPENESIKLHLGESFDVTVKRKQTAFHQERVKQQNAVKTKYKKEVTASYEIVFKNAKNEEVSVQYKDIFSGDWEIVKQSLNSTKVNSRINQWNVSVPAKGKTVLTYTVKSIY